MIVINKRRYMKKHAVGGSGLFDTIAKVFGKAASSSIGKTISNVATSSAVKNFVKSAGETASKELGSRAAKKVISAVLDDSRNNGPRIAQPSQPVDPSFSMPSTPATRMETAIEQPILNNNLTTRLIEKLLDNYKYIR